MNQRTATCSASISPRASLFEPRVGGRLYDRGVDERQVQLGTCLGLRPAHRIVISWTSARNGGSRPTATEPSRSRSGSSPKVPTAARVQLEHRDLDRHGEQWEGLREDISSDQGLHRSTYQDTPMCSRRRANGADRLAPKSHDRPRRSSPTSPTPRASSNGRKASSTAAWTEPGHMPSATAA